LQLGLIGKAEVYSYENLCYWQICACISRPSCCVSCVIMFFKICDDSLPYWVTVIIPMNCCSLASKNMAVSQ
jgi:hypothetical protein